MYQYIPNLAILKKKKPLINEPRNFAKWGALFGKL